MNLSSCILRKRQRILHREFTLAAVLPLMIMALLRPVLSWQSVSPLSQQRSGKLLPNPPSFLRLSTASLPSFQQRHTRSQQKLQQPFRRTGITTTTTTAAAAATNSAILNVALDVPLPVDVWMRQLVSTMTLRQWMLFNWTSRRSMTLTSFAFLWFCAVVMNRPDPWATKAMPLWRRLFLPGPVQYVWKAVRRAFRRKSEDVVVPFEPEAEPDVSVTEFAVTPTIEPDVSVAEYAFVATATEDDISADLAPRIRDIIFMPFDKDDAETNGWGACTLRSRERFGRTSFHRYIFDLPDPRYCLPLELGEPLNLCCLDREETPVQAEVYPFAPNASDASRTGSFSVLMSDPDMAPPPPSLENDTVGSYNSWNDVQQANLVRVLQNDLQVGDQVALQPSDGSNLEYHGQAWPVTEIVYLVGSIGIASVLDQIRSILESDDSSEPSSIHSVYVVWVNGSADDFDIIAEILERECQLHSGKLSVTCVVDDVRKQTDLSDCVEISETIPAFQPGAMAVLAGSRAFMKKGIAFLEEEKGFPRDCVCTM